MKNYELYIDDIKLTNNFDKKYLDDFVEIANENDLGFLLMNHGFNYPYTKEDALNFIDKNREAYNEIFEMDFYIFYKNNIAGAIGLSDIDHLNLKAHIGYWIGKKYRNNKIATKSLSKMVNFSKKELKLHSLYTEVLTNNIPSINVLLKNNFNLSGIKKDSFYYNNKFYSSFLFSLIL